MGKKYAINCGSAMLLRNKPEIFEGYEKVYINCGSTVISTKLQETLNKLNVSINSGSIEYVEVEGEVAVLEGDVYVTEKTLYGNVYLAAKDNLIVEPGGLNAFQNVTGAYVSGTLYLPASVDRSAIRNLTADHVVNYPDDAKVVIGDMNLNEEEAGELTDNKPYWVSGQVTALNGDALEALKKRGVTVYADRLLISHELAAPYRGVIEGGKRTVVPEGHCVVEGLSLGAGTSALYGDRLYVCGDFTVNLPDAAYLNDFKSIIVKGCATLPLSCVPGFKQIGKADEFFTYEGELIRIDGTSNLSHEMLVAARQAGISYTLKINGHLTVDDDVTAEDLGCIKAVYYNGHVNIEDGIRPVFARLVKEGNGYMGRLEDIAEQHAPGLMEEDTMKLNTGMFFL